MTNLRLERDQLVDMIAPLCGYSTPEAVYTIVGDLIGENSVFKTQHEKIDSSLHGRQIVQHRGYLAVARQWHCSETRLAKYPWRQLAYPSFTDRPCVVRLCLG